MSEQTIRTCKGMTFTEEVKQMVNQNNGDKKEVTRISISIDPSLRKNMRIAAAHADLEVGEWAKLQLERAAEKAMGRK